MTKTITNRYSNGLKLQHKRLYIVINWDPTNITMSTTYTLHDIHTYIYIYSHNLKQKLIYNPKFVLKNPPGPSVLRLGP